MFAIGPDGDSGALGKFTKSYEALYLPIAHDRVLVGKRDKERPTLALDEINIASVQHSLDTFFASRKTREEVKLAGEIGSGEPILSDEELSQMVGDSWNSLGKPKSEE